LTGTLAIQTEWGGDIYLYNLATGDLRFLTGGFDPAISPDGSQVAFTRSGGEHGLYLIGVDGSNERRIFSGRELLFSPKWSPNGRYLVFERGDESIQCLQFGPRCLPSPNRPLGERGATERQQQLARVDVNGANYQDVPSLPRARAPDWQAGGIVYHSPAGIQKTQDRPDARSELVFFNIRKQYELDPDWQPNGNRIVFQRREASHWQLFAVNADGTDLRGLTRPEFTLVDELPSSVAPAWSPDGRHIVFLSNRTAAHSTGPWRVWVMDADGGNQRPLPIDLPITYTFVGEQMVDWGR
jgi:Tol biopolymer transport system component